MPSGKNQSDHEDSTAEGSQGEFNFFMYKYPWFTWFNDVFWHGDRNPGNHVALNDRAYSEWKGNIFGIFRRPESRALSAFYHFAEGKGDVLEYASEIYGQQANMLTMGQHAAYKIRCEFRFRVDENCPLAKVSKPNGELAIERLKGFAFIGLLEEYDLSVCLFHRMFGGECLPVEFLNMRPHIASALETREKKARDLDLLRRHRDPIDGPLYDAAARIFWANVRRYDAHRRSCLETCSGAPHIFGGSSADAAAEGAPGARSSGREPRGLSMVSTDVRVRPEREYDWPGRYVMDD